MVRMRKYHYVYYKYAWQSGGGSNIPACVCVARVRSCVAPEMASIFPFSLSHSRSHFVPGRDSFHRNPLCFSLWYPDGSIKSNYWHHMLCVIFFHYLPAYFIDALLILFRKKPL